MPKFDSPISSKKFSGGQPMRELTIPDESDMPEDMTPVMRHRGPALHGSQQPVDTNAALAYQQKLEADNAQLEREIKEAKDARRLGRERLNDGAKRRLEMLLNMTYTTREVELLGNVFALRSLSGIETEDSYMKASEYDGTVRSPFEIRKQLLARSLTHIAGVEVSQFIGSNVLDAKLQLVDQLDEALLNRLFDEYSELVKEAKEKFALKTAQDVQEVIEDLKK